VRITFLDDKSFNSTSLTGLVEKMRARSFSPEESTEDYIRACARRWNKLGFHVSDTSAEDFVASLIGSGLVTVHSEGNA